MSDSILKDMDLRAYRYVVGYTAVSASATSKTMELWGPTANDYLVGFYARVNTAFAGVTRPEVKVGHDTTDKTDYLIPQQHIATARHLVIGKKHQMFCFGMDTQHGTGVTTHPRIVATFSSSSGNLSSLTAGEIEFVYIVASRKKE